MLLDVYSLKLDWSLVFTGKTRPAADVQGPAVPRGRGDLSLSICVIVNRQCSVTYPFHLLINTISAPVLSLLMHERSFTRSSLTQPFVSDLTLNRYITLFQIVLLEGLASDNFVFNRLTENRGGK